MLSHVSVAGSFVPPLHTALQVQVHSPFCVVPVLHSPTKGRLKVAGCRGVGVSVRGILPIGPHF